MFLKYVSLSSDWKRGSFYGPGMRTHRCTRDYEADRYTRADEDSDWSCERKQTRQRDLTSGLLTVNCPHGICLGFTLLRDAESERDGFKVFFTRFRERKRFSDQPA